jgi:hypothetical protein
MNPIRPHDIFVMAATIYGESRGTIQPDREDVGHTIMNRLTIGPAWMRRHADDIPDDTIEAVCRDPYQFSCWNPTDPNYPKLKKIMDDPVAAMGGAAFLKCLEAALRVINGHSKKVIGKSLHYHVKGMAFPKAWGRPVPVKHDNGFHLFYEGVQ